MTEENYLVSNQKLLNVIREHLPELGLGEFQAAMVCEQWMLDSAAMFSADHERQITLLDDIGNSIDRAASAYSQLHDHVRRGLESGFTVNMNQTFPYKELRVFSNRVDQNGENTKIPYRENSPLSLYLELCRAFLHGFDPGEQRGFQETNGVDAIAEAKERVADLSNPSAQQNSNETWQKAALVQRARELWRRGNGKNPPNQTSSGPFLDFVTDLIYAVERDWDSISTVNAWNTCRKLTNSKTLK